jgi:hypothetical protein
MTNFDPTDHETNKKLLSRDWIATNKCLIKNMRAIIKDPNSTQKSKDLALILIERYTQEIKTIEDGGDISERSV